MTESEVILSVCLLVKFITECSAAFIVICSSSVTLAICGIAKELLLIAASVVLFGDRLSGLNLLGFGLATVGIGWFKYDPSFSPFHSAMIGDRLTSHRCTTIFGTSRYLKMQEYTFAGSRSNGTIGNGACNVAVAGGKRGKRSMRMQDAAPLPLLGSSQAANHVPSPPDRP